LRQQLVLHLGRGERLGHFLLDAVGDVGRQAGRASRPNQELASKPFRLPPTCSTVGTPGSAGEGWSW
jgi:hypothetical protein